MGRALKILGGAVLLYFLIRRVKRAWKDRLALADLLVSLGDAQGDGKQAEGRPRTRHLFRNLPEPLMEKLGRSYAAAFVSNPMYKHLYQGSSQWRKRILCDLFKVLAVIGNDLGRSRFFVDASQRTANRNPEPLCFASVYRSTDSPAGLLDVINAGGLLTFVELGASSFLRSYAVEQWLVNLRTSVAPRADYFCIDHLFVPLKQQCTGVGSEMLAQISSEAALQNCPLLVMVTDAEAVDFFRRHHFRLLCEREYKPNESQDQTTFTVWIMWRDIQAA
jgi:hypothetical protein